MLAWALGNKPKQHGRKAPFRKISDAQLVTGRKPRPRAGGAAKAGPHRVLRRPVASASSVRPTALHQIFEAAKLEQKGRSKPISAALFPRPQHKQNFRFRRFMI